MEFDVCRWNCEGKNSLIWNCVFMSIKGKIDREIGIEFFFNNGCINLFKKDY